MAEMPQQELDLEALRRKKFRASELPISASQRAAVDNLLYLFKKKGGFDSARKQIWAGFNESEAKGIFTASLNEMAESEIDRDPYLLSRERGKAATLIEGAVDRSDLYKSVEAALDLVSSRHLDSIVTSLRAIRRQEAGDETAVTEQDRGCILDEEYQILVRAQREQREKARRQELEIQKQKAVEESKAKADELLRQREIRKQKDEESRKKQKEKEDQRRSERERFREQQRHDDQRDRESEGRYERETRETERDRTWRYRDRDYSGDRSREVRVDALRSKRSRSNTPKQVSPPPLDEKSLEDAALELLLREGKELAERSRQKPEFDFDQADTLEGVKELPVQKPRPPGTDGKFCRIDQAESRCASPRPNRDQSMILEEERGKSELGRDSLARRQERGHGDPRRASETRDSSRRHEISLRRDVYDRETDLYRPSQRNGIYLENRTDSHVGGHHSRSESRPAARDREGETEKSRDRGRARDRDSDRKNGNRDIDRSIFVADRGREAGRDKGERDSDRGRDRCGDWDRSRGYDRGRDWVRDGDRSYRPQNHPRSPSHDAPRRHRTSSRHRSRSRSRSLTRRSVRNEDRSASRARGRSTSRSMLDIDRYVPSTSNRSRSPKRREREREREREERARPSEIDRYIPGGNDQPGRGRQTDRDRESSWRRSRSR